MAYRWVKIWLAAFGLSSLWLAARVRGLEPSGGGMLWPLTTPSSISSSFGEFRDGHLHAGIDIRTFGREGVPCQAVADGEVTRMRASIFGYGKALYLRLSSGETAVYAHLSEFSPQLEMYLFDEQQRRRSYEVDLYQPPGRFRFKKGEIIGYTGSTGGVPPHLHFEIRDAGERPLNPLTHGWPIPDRMLPDFDQIVWIPRDRAARLNGSPFPREITVRRESAGHFVCPDTVVLHGAWGIAARIFDRLGAASDKLAPYRVDLFAGGRHLARLDLERFSFTQADQQELLYEMERALATNRYYFNMFEREGELIGNCWFENRGLISSDSLAAGGDPNGDVHEVVMQATDPAGNISSLAIPIRLETAGAVPAVTFEGYRSNQPGAAAGLFIYDDILCLDEGCLDPETADHLEAVLNLLGFQTAPPPARPGRGVLVLTSRDLGAYPVVPLKTAADGDVYLVPVSAGRAGLRIIPDLEVSLFFTATSFFGRGIIYVKPAGLTDVGRPDPTGLTPLRPEIYLGPPSLALRAPLELSFPASDTTHGRPAVYRLNEGKFRWDYLDTVQGGDSVRAKIQKAGVYSVLADGTAPWIGPPQLVRHTMYSDGRTCPEIVVPIEDAGSGVDGLKSTVILADREQIARWDSSAKKLFVLLADPNIIGLTGGETGAGAGDSPGRPAAAAPSPGFSVTVRAVDRVGNEAVLTTRLKIPEAYYSPAAERKSKHAE